jgi:perosamine synthetase
MTVPASPFPRLRNLLKAFTVPPLAGEAWFAPKDRAAALRFYNRGSLALAAGIEAIRKAGGAATITVWVPDYFCDEALVLLRDLGVNLKFYPIEADLTPHWQFLEKLADRTDYPQVLVLVHYFGFPNAGREARRFCDRHEMALLEDSAHVLAPGFGMGIGDLQIFSPRKVLPVPAGGVLILPEKLVPYLDGHDKNPPKTAMISWLCRRLIQRLLVLLHLNWHRFWNIAPNGQPPERQGRLQLSGPWPGDSYTLRLLQVMAEELREAVAARRRNYLELARAISGLGRVRPLFPELGEEVCPYAFPILIEHGSDGVLATLNAAGIPASRWPTLPPEVLAREMEYQVAIQIHWQMLLLPVHQGLSPCQLNWMGARLREALGGNSST